MPNINAFRNIAQNSPQARVFVKKDQVSSGTGLVQWIKGHVLSSHNRKATNLFIQSLKQSYGEDIAHTVSERTNLNQLASGGKILHSREVTSALELAEQLKSDFVAANDSAVANYARVTKRDGKEVSLLDHAINANIRKFVGKDGDITEMRKLIDTNELADQMRTELIDSKNNVLGEEKAPKLLSVDDLSKHVEYSVTQKIHAHYSAKFLTFLGSLNDPDSMSTKAYKHIAKQSGADINMEKLTPSIKGNLDDKIDHEISRHLSKVIKSVVKGEEKRPLPELLDDTHLQNITEKTMQKSINQRIVAHEKAQQVLDTMPNGGALTTEEKKQILDFPLHNDVDAEYMLPLSNNITPMREALGELASPDAGKNPAQLTANIKSVHDVLNHAINAKGEYIDADARPTLLKGFSKFYLQSSSLEEKQHILENLKNPDGPFKKVMQACEYTRFVLPNSEEALSEDPAVEAQMNHAVGSASAAQQIFTALITELENEVDATEHFAPESILVAGDLPQGHIDAVRDTLGFEIPQVHPLDQ